MQVLTNNPSLYFISRYPVAFESTHVPSSPSSTELDECTYFKSFRGHQQLASSPPSRLSGTVRTYIFSTPQVIESPVFFVQIALHMTISSSKHLFFSSQDFFEPRAPLIQSNARVASFSFVRYIVSTSHEGGRSMHASIFVSIIISELH